MEDFKNSVAHLDVEVSTNIEYESVVGENFYRFLYVSQKTGLAPTLLTKDTYADVLSGLISDPDNLKLALKNLASLFQYGENVRGYFISASDYEKFKYKGYFVYLESEYASILGDVYTPVVDPDPSADPSAEGWYEESGSGYVLSADTSVDSGKTYYVKTQEYVDLDLTTPCKDAFDAIDTVLDSAYSQVITDIAIPFTAKSKSTPVAKFEEKLNAYTMKVSAFLRGANEDYTWDKDGDGNVAVGLSPALYQLGRTLAFTNSTGTPVGNSCDSVACEQADVLVTRSTSAEEIENPSAQLIEWMQNAKLQYFKTVGNNTGNLSCYGGWTTKGSCVCADWIVAYINHMTKVGCAQIVTAMNTFRDGNSYDACIAEMDDQVSAFVSMGRITAYKITAPAFGKVNSNGHTIVIPDAWTGIYVDNLRNVKIQGALTVEA